MSLCGPPGVARPSPPDHQGLLVSNTLLPHHGRPWGPLHTRGVPPPAIRSERHQTCAQTSVTPSASPNTISATGHQNMLGSQSSRTRHGHALGSLLHGVLRVYACGRIHRQVNSRGGPGDMPVSPGCGSGQPHQPLHGASAPATEQDRPLQAWSRHLPWPHRRCLMPSGGYFGLLCHTPSHSQAILRLQRWLSTALSHAGVDTAHYSGHSGHSFRVGAATTAARAGHSQATIKMLWHTWHVAYERYIRTPR